MTASNSTRHECGLQMGEMNFSLFTHELGASYVCCIENNCLSDLDERRLLAFLSSENESPRDASASPVRVGRKGVKVAELNSGKRVVFRCFYRGGLIAPLFNKHHFKMPASSLMATRPVSELLTLALLNARGVKVPKPQAAVVRVGKLPFFYTGAIVTEEIRPCENALVVACEAKVRSESQDRFLQICQAAGAEAAKMLVSGVMHVDLHPGNVLVAENNQVFLIDFDKACFLEAHLGLSSWQEKLIRRWKKSVEKHGLGEPAVEAFTSGLREKA